MAKKLREYDKGERLDCFAAVQQCEKKEARTGKSYLRLTFSDASGSLDCSCFDDTERIARIARTGEIVRVEGSLDTYDGRPVIKLFDVHPLGPEDDVDPADFAPASIYDNAAMWRELQDYAGSVGNTYLRQLLDRSFGDPDFAARFRRHTAAKAMHHACVGGLLEHTLGVVRLCSDFAARYPRLNRDLLLTGAMLHDVGKLTEMEGLVTVEYTDEGQLLGHIASGFDMVSASIENIPGFPADLRLQLLHLILSHHGKLEFGSPVVPRTPEAMALSQADLLDAHFFSAFKAVSEEAGNPGGFTSRVKALDTAIYKTPGALAGSFSSMAAPAGGAAPRPKAAPARDQDQEAPGNPRQTDLF